MRSWLAVSDAVAAGEIAASCAPDSAAMPVELRAATCAPARAASCCVDSIPIAAGARPARPVVEIDLIWPGVRGPEPAARRVASWAAPRLASWLPVSAPRCAVPSDASCMVVRPAAEAPVIAESHAASSVPGMASGSAAT